MKPPVFAIAAMLGLIAGVAFADTGSAPEPVETTVTTNGLVADFYLPANARGRLPTIIMLGGSDGGLAPAPTRDSKVLARQGFAVLHLAYFDAPGLPKDLALIPLEYFKTAIDWLRAQPSVDPDRIGIVGASIGGMVALTVASHYPEIKVVVAAVPSSVVWAGIIHTPGDPPSTFTLAGKPLPYLPYVGPFTTVYNLYAKGLLALDQHRNAIIPVERINGPVLVICGKSDALWPSCPMSEQVIGRLKAKHFDHAYQLLEYADAGHYVFGQPKDTDSPDFAGLAKEGGSPGGNNTARRDSWERTVALLDSILKH